MSLSPRWLVSDRSKDVISVLFLFNIFRVGVSCRILYSFVGYLYVSGSQLPRFWKRELICLLLFTCNYVVSVGEISSSSGCLGWATLLAHLSR